MTAFFGFVGSPRDASGLDLRAVSRVLLTHGAGVRTFEDRDLEGRYATVLAECGEDGRNGVARLQGRDSRPALAPVLLFDGPRRDVIQHRLVEVRDVDSFVMSELDVAALRGGFAFAIWSRTHRTLALGCDPDGMRSLYFAGSERWFAFSTDLGALLACGLVKPKLSSRALLTFLRHGACGDLSLVSGVRSLRAGWYVIVRPFSSSTGRLLDTTSGDRDRLVELRETLAAQISRGDPAALVSVGAGACRSSLVGVAREAGAEPIVELSFMRKGTGIEGVARHYIDLSTYEPEDVLDGVLSSVDQPTGDGIGAWLAASEARRLGARLLLCDISPCSEAPPAPRPLAGRVLRKGDSPKLFGRREISRLLRVPADRVASMIANADPPAPRRVAARSFSRMAMTHSISCCAPVFDLVSAQDGRRSRRARGEPSGPGFGTVRRWILDRFVEQGRDAFHALAESGAMDGTMLRSLWNRFRFDVDERTTAQVWALTSLGSWVRRHEVGGIEP